MSDIAPLTVPVFDLQGCDWLAPYCRETCVIYNNYRVRYGWRQVTYKQFLTGVTLHPDIVCFFLFFHCAGVAEARYVSSPPD